MLSLLRLLDTGNVWVKASGAYETSRTGAPDYADVAPIARALIAAAPERVVWASNWPHGGSPHKPDDADLLDVLSHWTDQSNVIEQILVHNPDKLYFGR
jgi:D-galactarolactone isomerase